MQVRKATATDAETIMRLINAAFRLAEGFLLDRDRIDQEGVGVLLSKGTFLVVEDHDVLLGCVYIEPRVERSYLGLLAVDPQRQKTGLGSALMTAAEKHCAQAGFRFMDLRIINVRREMHRFYSLRGYLESGTEPFTPGLNPKVPCHFVKMSKPLS